MIMEKTFRYFQPEYVDNFKCDGSKCNARCCKGWTITIDEKSYEQYSNIEPPETAKEITACMKFDSERKQYVMMLKPNGFCPMLTEKNLCRLQANYGENFLSTTCTTYPRYTNQFGDFFERSLTLSCPVAAEMILFAQEPLRFLFVDVDEKVHSNGGKIIPRPFSTKKFLAEELFGVQGTMISILQERRLSINQRLLALRFFLEDFEEFMSVEVSSPKESFDWIRALRKLTSSYNPRVFLREGVPPTLENFPFDAKNFITFMMILLEPFYLEVYKRSAASQKYFDAINEILQMYSNKSRRLPLEDAAKNYMALADERKKFLEKHSPFLENYLVNELFLNLYPWKLEGGVAKNFAVFLMTFKVFELIIFSATLKGFDGKSDLLKVVDWFARKIDHNNELQKKILEVLKNEDDSFSQAESLLEN